jgi:hypothetical protein
LRAHNVADPAGITANPENRIAICKPAIAAARAVESRSSFPFLRGVDALTAKTD